MFWWRDSQDRGYSASTSTSPERRASSRHNRRRPLRSPHFALNGVAVSRVAAGLSRLVCAWATQLLVFTLPGPSTRFLVVYYKVYYLYIASVKVETLKAVFAHRAKAGRVNTDHRIWLCRCFLVVCCNGDKYWSVEIWFMRSFFERAHAAVKNGYTCLCKAEAAQTASEYYADIIGSQRNGSLMQERCTNSLYVFMYTIKAFIFSFLSLLVKVILNGKI